MPTATLDLTGVATYEVFLRGTLDRIGTYPDFMHIGDYKTAINMYTEKGFTPAHKEMSAALNRDQYDQLVRAIADGRRMPEADVRSAIDDGPLLPDEALRHGLVDDLAYEDELDDLVQDVGRPGELHLLESDDYANVTWESLGVRRRSKIAVLNAVGAITSGRGGYDPLDGAVLGSDSLVKYIRDIRGDASIRAIVLRVDSPGGSSTASDVIWRELTITKAIRTSVRSSCRCPISPPRVAITSPWPATSSSRSQGPSPVDRDLHRQVRHGWHVRQAGREHRRHQHRPSRRDQLTRSPVHSR